MMKKINGIYYTIYNPFDNVCFKEWFNNINNYYDINELTFLEPFAGSNNIVNLIESLNLKKPKSWDCFDINESSENKVKEFKIVIRDTLRDFPKGYKIAITNPPYLAKNKATLMKLKNYDNNYDDLYMKCLDIMLKNVEFIATIIPESFITSNKFQERLYAVISLEMKMFEDTECPVCLALFNKEKTDDFFVVKRNRIVGKYLELKEILKEYKSEINWKFNDSNGNIGLMGVDNTREESIKFIKGEEIKNEIKQSSRAITRISGYSFKNEEERENFIFKLNEILKEYRDKTNDVFLTSFKGLRKDLKYRRRLDYKTAKNILNKTYNKIYNNRRDIL